MTAKEMFNEIGMNLVCDNTFVTHYQIRNIHIKFDKMIKGINAYIDIGDGEEKPFLISPYLISCINKQCIEFNWDDFPNK